MNAMKIGRGIFIDNECSGIRQVEEGFFVPSFGPTCDKDEEYRQDLAVFLKKWFEISAVGSTSD